MSKKWTIRIMILAVLSLMLSLGTYYLAQGMPGQEVQAQTLSSEPGVKEALNKPSLPAMNAAKQMSDAFVAVANRVTPSIVMIVNEEKLENALGDENFQQLFQDDFFRRFFDFTPEQREQVQKTLGSGVVVDPDGYIVTNNHVVEHSTKLQVTLPDGSKMPAKIIGTDPKTDLALIKVDSKHLKAIQFAQYDQVQVGEWVLAIGSPFGEALQQTVTAGIISAKGRSNVGIADYEDFLQTDAAINPGNSGGALVDLDGNLVGINTAIMSSNGSNAGVGFAIPVHIVQDVMEQLRSNGRVVRGFLGVTIQSLTPDLQKSLGSKDNKGAIVSDVQKGSPADKAGLKPYDLITSVNGQPVQDSVALRNRIAAIQPGTKTELGIVRDGKAMNVTIKVGEMENESPVRGPERERQHKLGMELQNLTPSLAQQLRTDQEQGVVVARVLPGSAADNAGLQRGDVIFELNRKPVTSVRNFQEMLSGSGNTVLLAVDRQGNSFFVTLDVD